YRIVDRATIETAMTACAIVTFNSAGTIERTLRSLPPEIRVVVVDNGSSDSTPDVVRHVRPDAELVSRPENPGFAAAVNSAIARLEGEAFVLLLNPDAHLAPG